MPEQVAAEEKAEWGELPPKEPPPRAIAKVPLPFASDPAPAQGFAPAAQSRPEFLARDSVCKRVTVKQVPGCAKEWTADCDKALLAAAYQAPKTKPTTGECYYHDRAGCPDCACDYYVKVRKQGFDGGTGCLGTPEDVLAALYGECAAQRCEPRAVKPR